MAHPNVTLWESSISLQSLGPKCICICIGPQARGAAREPLNTAVFLCFLCYVWGWDDNFFWQIQVSSILFFGCKRGNQGRLSPSLDLHDNTVQQPAIRSRWPFFEKTLESLSSNDLMLTFFLGCSAMWRWNDCTGGPFAISLAILQCRLFNY